MAIFRRIRALPGAHVHAKRKLLLSTLINDILVSIEWARYGRHNTSHVTVTIFQRNIYKCASHYL